MNKQPPYVAPGVAVCRIAMEAGIAVVTSIGAVSAQTEDWSSTVVTHGNDFAEGGEVYWYW
jgi:ABC-type sugar transport system substrate-binding protein